MNLLHKQTFKKIIFLNRSCSCEVLWFCDCNVIIIVIECMYIQSKSMWPLYNDMYSAFDNMHTSTKVCILLSVVKASVTTVMVTTLHQAGEN